MGPGHGGRRAGHYSVGAPAILGLSSSTRTVGDGRGVGRSGDGDDAATTSIAIAVERTLEVPEEKMNPVGGAVALGHPIGATGAVLTVKILHHLARTGGQYGLVTLCIGGGMGIAAIFERVAVSFN